MTKLIEVLKKWMLGTEVLNEELVGRVDAASLSLMEGFLELIAKIVELEAKIVALESNSEKRKLEDKETLENNEPVKRQRRCNRFNSPNGRDTQKERIVLPSQKPKTNSLRIDCFLRPFTLNAVKELLGKTGTVTPFWMDQIKTHCFYSSVEEAADSRNALYNLQWPPNGGCLLEAEFVDAQEVKSHLEAPPSPAQVNNSENAVNTSGPNLVRIRPQAAPTHADTVVSSTNATTDISHPQPEKRLLFQPESDIRSASKSYR